MLNKNIRQIIEKNNLNLVLLDLGASGGTYKPFESLLNYSRLIEVDPDDRDFINQVSNKEKRIVVREAIIGSSELESADIYLTSDPHCSSTLRPDFSKLSNYSYADLFEVRRIVSVPATSLDRLSRKLNTHFDWMKIDTQGSELEILQSMQGPLLDRLICCDAEIGLYSHYINSVSFSKFHDFMTANGFQIANLIRVQSRLRLRKEDVDPFIAPGGSQSALNRWPTSLELRYIRSVGHDEPLPVKGDFLRLWLIAYSTDNYAYCYFLARRLEEDNPELMDLAKLLQNTCIKAAGFSRGLRKKLKENLVKVVERILS
jgi:FkbM family methyltransferase